MCEREGSSHKSKPKDRAVPATSHPQGSMPFRSIFTVQHGTMMPITSTHPSSPTMSPLYRAKPPKETATADEGGVIFHIGKSHQSMMKLERNYKSLEADPSYDQHSSGLTSHLKCSFFFPFLAFRATSPAQTILAQSLLPLHQIPFFFYIYFLVLELDPATRENRPKCIQHPSSPSLSFSASLVILKHSYL